MMILDSGLLFLGHPVYVTKREIFFTAIRIPQLFSAMLILEEKYMFRTVCRISCLTLLQKNLTSLAVVTKIY